MMSTTLHLSDSGRNVSLRMAGAGAPVVLIHGVGMQAAAWEPQIKVLSATHRVIAADMPGHGGSDPLPQDSQLPDYVTWCHQLIRALNVGPVNIAGHSMGALIAGGFGVEHPDMTTRISLLNGVFCRDALARQAVINRAAAIRAGHIDLETPLSRWFGDTPMEHAARAHVAEWLGAVDPDGYSTAYTAFARGDAIYADRYHQIRCPFLALTADQDPNSTPAMSHAMADRVQNGRAVVVPGHRHMVNLTAPGIVSGHLLDWLCLPAEQKELQ